MRHQIIHDRQPAAQTLHVHSEEGILRQQFHRCFLPHRTTVREMTETRKEF